MIQRAHKQAWGTRGSIKEVSYKLSTQSPETTRTERKCGAAARRLRLRYNSFAENDQRSSKRDLPCLPKSSGKLSYRELTLFAMQQTSYSRRIVIHGFIPFLFLIRLCSQLSKVRCHLPLLCRVHDEKKNVRIETLLDPGRSKKYKNPRRVKFELIRSQTYSGSYIMLYHLCLR